MHRFKIADVVFDVKLNFKRTLELCERFLYEGEKAPEYSFEVTMEDIEKEKGHLVDQKTYSDSYYEGLVVFRSLCDHLLRRGDGMIFHCSALAVDGKAYLFTAPSGTGKSTHARLWRELLGDKVTMINDDKPIIRLIDGKFYVYGTPWQGKHNLGVNDRAEISAVIEVKRGEQNTIEKIAKDKLILTVFNQTIRPSDPQKMMNLMDLTDKLLRSVETYRLYCNTDISAAKIAYEALSKGDGYEN